MEQQVFYDLAHTPSLPYMDGSPGPAAPLTDLPHWSLPTPFNVKYQMRFMLCPSSPVFPAVPFDGLAFGGNATTHYAFCYGDTYDHYWFAITPARPSRGLFFGEGSVQNATFGFPENRRIAQVTDGTSNTLAMSELSSAQSLGSTRIVGNVIAGIPAWPPSNCLVHRRGANLAPVSPAVLFADVTSIPARMAYRGGTAGFNTILPPNSVACFLGGGWGQNVQPPQSYHPGGVNALMADGSVRFLSENINTGNTGSFQAANNSIPSPYGVFGALGTIAAGEVVGDF